MEEVSIAPLCEVRYSSLDYRVNSLRLVRTWPLLKRTTRRSPSIVLVRTSLILTSKTFLTRTTELEDEAGEY